VGDKLDDAGEIIDPVRVDWESGGAFVTPPGAAGAEAVFEGDARLAAFPGTSSLALDVNGDVLLADRRAHLVRRLVTRRGVR
jgi:hypothetical protein